MAEHEIDAEIIKHTQAILGKYVKKPALSEKLLRKPPFRFLFDVFSSVIRDTGYFAGLYTADELNYENIKDREDKMRFLQKMIDAIKITTAQSISVRTSKIVSGHEPEKTNELLALIGEVIDKQMEWQSAVQQLLNTSAVAIAGAVDIVEPKPKQSVRKEKSVDKAKNQQQLKDKVKTVNKTKDKEKQVKPTKTVKQISPNKKEAKVKEESKEKLQRKPSKEHAEHEAKVKEESKEKLQRKPSKERAEPETKEKDKTRRGSKDNMDKTKVTKSLQKQSTKEDLKKELKSSKNEIQSYEQLPAQHKTETISSLAALEATHEPVLPAEVMTIEAKIVDDSPKQTESSKSSGKNRRSSAKLKEELKSQDSLLNSLNNLESLNTLNDAIEIENKQVEKEESLQLVKNTTQATRKKSADQSAIVKRESTFTRENSMESSSTTARPRTSLRPPSARPASARPGAPRRRDKNVEIILQPNEPVNVGGINVTLDAFNDLDDDGEHLVVIEDASHVDSGLGTQENTQNITALNEQLEQQGHLVQQILETQKELVQQTEENMQKKQNERINSATLAQSSARQVNTLRDIIQNLTKFINPLGKVMDFVPEDIDAMQLELNMWHDTYLQAAQELRREKSLTEETTEPLKHQLSQIDESIKEYVEIVNSSRINIIQNSERINKLLTGSK